MAPTQKGNRLFQRHWIKLASCDQPDDLKIDLKNRIDEIFDVVLL